MTTEHEFGYPDVAYSNHHFLFVRFREERQDVTVVMLACRHEMKIITSRGGHEVR